MGVLSILVTLVGGGSILSVDTGGGAVEWVTVTVLELVPVWRRNNEVAMWV